MDIIENGATSVIYSTFIYFSHYFVPISNPKGEKLMLKYADGILNYRLELFALELNRFIQVEFVWQA